MALPTTGPITAALINAELGKAANAPFSLGAADARALAGKPSGQIAYSDFRGKSKSAKLTIGKYISPVLQGNYSHYYGYATTTNAYPTTTPLRFGSLSNAESKYGIVTDVLMNESHDYGWYYHNIVVTFSATLAAGQVVTIVIGGLSFQLTALIAGKSASLGLTAAQWATLPINQSVVDFEVI